MENVSFADLFYLEDGVKFRKENRTEIQILKQVQDDRQPQTSLFHVMLNLFQHLINFDPIRKEGQNGLVRFNG